MMSKPPITPGVRGWLLIVAVLVLVAPGNFLAHAVFAEREFDSPLVRAFCDPANPGYDARWPAFIITETKGFQALAFGTFFVLWPLFVTKHRLFPSAFAILGLMAASLFAVRAGLASTISTVAPQHRSAIYSQTALGLPVFLALVAYIIRSRRAQMTFVYKIVPCPFFPFFTRAPHPRK